jgi:deoxyribose-phosphate aldolase
MNNNLNRLIDHTNLNIDATKADIQKLVREAIEFNFNSICVRANWLEEFAKAYRVSVVSSFPENVFNVSKTDEVKQIIGNAHADEKFAEVSKIIRQGASEIDPVINISKLEQLHEEMDIYYEAVMQEQRPVIIKPIFSCEILSDEELEFSIAKYSDYAKRNQEDKIKYCYKNSTGFIKSNNPELLKTSSVKLVTAINKYFELYDPMQLVAIKIAGGVRSVADIENFQAILQERLSHIGTSSGADIFSFSAN